MQLDLSTTTHHSDASFIHGAAGPATPGPFHRPSRNIPKAKSTPTTAGHCRLSAVIGTASILVVLVVAATTFAITYVSSLATATAIADRYTAALVDSARLTATAQIGATVSQAQGLQQLLAIELGRLPSDEDDDAWATGAPRNDSLSAATRRVVDFMWQRATMLHAIKLAFLDGSGVTVRRAKQAGTQERDNISLTVVHGGALPPSALMHNAADDLRCCGYGYERTLELTQTSLVVLSQQQQQQQQEQRDSASLGHFAITASSLQDGAGTDRRDTRRDYNAVLPESNVTAIARSMNDGDRPAWGTPLFSFSRKLLPNKTARIRAGLTDDWVQNLTLGDDGEDELLVHRGSSQWCLPSLFPIRNASGVVVAALHLCTAVAPLRQTLESLEYISPRARMVVLERRSSTVLLSTLPFLRQEESPDSLIDATYCSDGGWTQLPTTPKESTAKSVGQYACLWFASEHHDAGIRAASLDSSLLRPPPGVVLRRTVNVFGQPTLVVAMSAGSAAVNRTEALRAASPNATSDADAVLTLLMLVPQDDILGNLHRARNTVIGSVAGVVVLAAVASAALVVLLLEPVRGIAERLARVAELQKDRGLFVTLPAGGAPLLDSGNPSAAQTDVPSSCWSLRMSTDEQNTTVREHCVNGNPAESATAAESRSGRIVGGRAAAAVATEGARQDQQETTSSSTWSGGLEAPLSSLHEVGELQLAFESIHHAVHNFTRYVPIDTVRYLLAEGQLCRLGMSPTHCTVLFCDAVGFSSICERLRAGALSRLIRTYFTQMSKQVSRHGGAVDKFIGDCVMAVWGAPFRVDRREVRATLCALHMVRACAVKPLAGLVVPGDDRSSRQSEVDGSTGNSFSVRCGVATGTVLAGTMGSSDRMNYTVVGSTVTLASQLEGLNRRLGTSVLVCEATRQRLHNWFCDTHLCRVPFTDGKRRSVAVYNVTGLRPRDTAFEDPVASSSRSRARRADANVRGYAASAASYDSIATANAAQEAAKATKSRNPAEAGRTTHQLLELARSLSAPPLLMVAPIEEAAADLFTEASLAYTNGDFRDVVRWLRRLSRVSVLAAKQQRLAEVWSKEDASLHGALPDESDGEITDSQESDILDDDPPSPASPMLPLPSSSSDAAATRDRCALESMAKPAQPACSSPPSANPPNEPLFVHLLRQLTDAALLQSADRSAAVFDGVWHPAGWEWG